MSRRSDRDRKMFEWRVPAELAARHRPRPSHPRPRRPLCRRAAWRAAARRSRRRSRRLPSPLRPSQTTSLSASSPAPSTAPSPATSRGAREDLDEAHEIAERGPMRLHLADIHLHRARLFGLLAEPSGQIPLDLAARRPRQGAQADRAMRLQPPPARTRGRRGGACGRSASGPGVFSRRSHAPHKQCHSRESGNPGVQG